MQANRLAESKLVNPLMPNDPYRGLTAPLTSKVAFYIFIQQTELLNILKMVYTLRFFSSKCSLFHNSNVFGSCIIHILYIGCAKIKKKNNFGAKRFSDNLENIILNDMRNETKHVSINFTSSEETLLRVQNCMMT
jgi:hypothetical protein